MRRYNTSPVCGRLQSATTKKKKEAAAAATKSYAQAQALALERYKRVEHLLQLHYYTGLGPFTS